ncbi:hypothetical protein ACFPRL_08080 [Pseudoclavibacter helvolus]
MRSRPHPQQQPTRKRSPCRALRTPLPTPGPLGPGARRGQPRHSQSWTRVIRPRGARLPCAWKPRRCGRCAPSWRSRVPSLRE